MNIFDYTDRGRRPTAQQIVSDWKKADRPAMFQVEYGETFAQFESITTHSALSGSYTRWHASGNGCTGFKRDQVVILLNRIAQEPQ